MKKWNRYAHLPVLPLGEDGRRATGCAEHIALSRKAAAQGMVLLKNENEALPLPPGKRIALFGKASADYVKGGGGSGDVTVAWVKNLIDGMEEKEAQGKVGLFAPLNGFYREFVREQYRAGVLPGQAGEPEVPEELMRQARAFTDTAVFSVCRFSGEDWDRSDSDFYLTQEEAALARRLEETFPCVIAVLNVGGMVDTSWLKGTRIRAALLAWQGGMAGGPAEADVLCGDENPSGKLADTFASCFEDYPSSPTFHESEDYVAYEEDIYVGYRYFETVPGAAEKVNYCFGYGLSYTEFEIRFLQARQDGDDLLFDACVTNLEKRARRETVMLYVSGPQGRLGRPARELKAFRKTRTLQAGESQRLRLTVSRSSLAAYDDVGAVCESAWVLEEGSYRFYLGNAVRSARETGFVLNVERPETVSRLTKRCAPRMLKERLRPDGSMEPVASYTGNQGRIVWDEEMVKAHVPSQKEIPGGLIGWEKGALPPRSPQLIDVAKGAVSLDAFLDSLSDEELAHLLGGQPNTGVANTFGIGNLPEAGVPNVMTADGPAGLRIEPECEVDTTAWPCATLLACSFDEELVESVGRAGALEVKENNIGVWLTPAMNIHRSPLCGRNFEYYSEDPLVAGKMGAAMVRGIQSRQIAASVKHFACNNKETNRKNSDSRLSERALREIYLKGFEIVVKEADPWTIMTSYNVINGTRASENRELLTGILREEWGFAGMVTSDWWNFASHGKEVAAGNDLKMPVGKPEALLSALEAGELQRSDLAACAKRVLALILKL